MDNDNSLNFEQLAVDCGINNGTEGKLAKEKILLLSSKYPNEELILIYNYFLSVSDSYEIMVFLIDKINRFRDPSSVPILIDTLLMKDKLSKRIGNDNSIRIRINIIKTLANIKDSSAVNPLLYCMNNKNEPYQIKLSCADALGKIGDKYAVLPLVNLLEDENESSLYVKESAVSALGMIGDEKAIDSLVSILESKHGFMNKFTFLKERALEALNKINFLKGDKVIKALKHSLEDESPQIRINAIEVLMNSDDDRAENLIRKMLNDKNEEVVKNAVFALYNLIGDDILNEIHENSDCSPFVKKAALELMKEIENSEDELNENEDNNE